MFDIIKSNNEIHMTGRFDASCANRASEIFESVNTTFYVNFDGLDYISSAGLSVLLKTQKRLMEKGDKLIMKKMNRFNREIFKLAGFDTIFEIED